MSKEITVDLIDDDEAVLDALGCYLERRGMRVKRFARANDYVAAEQDKEPPDCIVADIRMSGMTGIELQQWLRARGSPTPLILITGFADVSIAVGAMKAGALDFLEKPVDERRLVSSIRLAADQGAARSEQLEEIRAISQRLETLTEREREVMGHAVHGKTSREIGALLGISPRTVEIHRSSVMDKMECESLADLVRKSMKHELFAPETAVEPSAED